MKKRLLILSMAMVMVLGTITIAFGSSTINNINAPTSSEDNIPITRSSKDKVVKEFVNKDSGTAYSDDKKKKVAYVENHYKIYYENMATGNKRFQYHQYEWSWKGYEKDSSGNWVYKTQKSGTNREHLDPKSYISSFL